jgi:hypothetical protein
MAEFCGAMAKSYTPQASWRTAARAGGLISSFSRKRLSLMPYSGDNIESFQQISGALARHCFEQIRSFFAYFPGVILRRSEQHFGERCSVSALIEAPIGHVAIAVPDHLQLDLDERQGRNTPPLARSLQFGISKSYPGFTKTAATILVETRYQVERQRRRNTFAARVRRSS